MLLKALDRIVGMKRSSDHIRSSNKAKNRLVSQLEAAADGEVLKGEQDAGR